ncbi:MAG: Uma2 family endonuclease [Vulcanimicrobiaceae bacterium]
MAIGAAAVGEQIVASGEISWAAYAALVRELGEHSRLRVAYSEGTLEIMSPSPEHEALSRLIDVLIAGLSLKWGLDIEAYGSMTLQLPTVEEGAELDSCYYVQRASAMRGRRAIDLRADPAPDIVLEVDLTSSRISSMISAPP